MICNNRARNILLYLLKPLAIACISSTIISLIMKEGLILALLLPPIPLIIFHVCSNFLKISSFLAH